MTYYPENNYLNQYGDQRLFCKVYFGDQILSLIIKHEKVKTHYPKQVIDVRFQVDYVTPKKYRPFEKHHTDPFDTSLFVLIPKQKK